MNQPALAVFETTRKAQKWHRSWFALIPRSTRADARRVYQLYRNVFIDWTAPPPKPVRSIILGCLRTA